MSYQCPVLIEFTPRGGSAVTLVPAAGWLADLPELVAEQRLMEADGVLTANSFFRPLGGATVRFPLAIETDEASCLASQNGLRNVTLSGSGALAFIAASWRADFAQAAITDITPELPSDTGAPTLVRTLQVTCGLPEYSLIP